MSFNEQNRRSIRPIDVENQYIIFKTDFTKLKIWDKTRQYFTQQISFLLSL